MCGSYAIMSGDRDSADRERPKRTDTSDASHSRPFFARKSFFPPFSLVWTTLPTSRSPATSRQSAFPIRLDVTTIRRRSVLFRRRKRFSRGSDNSVGPTTRGSLYVSRTRRANRSLVVVAVRLTTKYSKFKLYHIARYVRSTI